MIAALLALVALQGSTEKCRRVQTPEGPPPLVSSICESRQTSAAPARDPSWVQHYLEAADLFGRGDRDEAVQWFYIGQLRGRVHAACVPQHPSAAPAVLASLNATLGQAINEYAGGSPADWAIAIDRALAWDQAHPDLDARTSACEAERLRQREGLAGLARQIRADAEEIRRQRTANGLPNR